MSSNYIKLIYNNNHIEHDTGRALLIKVMGEDRKFWIPKSLTFPAKNRWDLYISIPKDMTIKTFKNGNGKYNKTKVISEEEYNGYDFVRRFHPNAKIQEDDEDKEE